MQTRCGDAKQFNFMSNRSLQNEIRVFDYSYRKYVMFFGEGRKPKSKPQPKRRHFPLLLTWNLQMSNAIEDLCISANFRDDVIIDLTPQVTCCCIRKRPSPRQTTAKMIEDIFSFSSTTCLPGVTSIDLRDLRGNDHRIFSHFEYLIRRPCIDDQNDRLSNTKCTLAECKIVFWNIRRREHILFLQIISSFLIYSKQQR